MAARTLLDTLPFVLIISAGVALAKSWLDSQLALLVPLAIAYAYMALFAHRSILLGVRLSWADAVDPRSAAARGIPVGPFLWRLLGWWAVIAAVWLAGFLALYRWVQQSEDQISRAMIEGTIFLGFAFAVILTLPLLAALGTILPAAAVGGDASLGAAWQRGRKTFWRTLGHLLGGNVLFFVVTTGVLLLVWPAEETAVTRVISDFVSELLGLFMVMLTAAALSLAYQRADPALAASG